MRKSLPPFLLGFIATSFQILLLREFNAHFYGNELTFGLVLAAWLFWGGLGSICASRYKLQNKHFVGVYTLVVFLFSLCLLGLRFSRFALGLLPGELTGLLPVIGLSLGFCLLVSLPLGALFVFNVRWAEGRLAAVYVLESLGATVAGLVVYFFLLPFFSSWLAAALIGATSLLLIFFFVGDRKKVFVLIVVLPFLAALAIADLPSQTIYWKPFRLVASTDSRYGRLQAIKTEEQVSLYSNSLQVYSYPDRAAAEESVHFALLQNPEAKAVLLIGGGAGGGLTEILKYPFVQLDYVELDPEIIRFSRRFLPPEERKILSSPRVHLFFQDGRAFLQKAKKTYDQIILNLPEPTTAQINRFYTREFFLLARKRLALNGVFSFSVPSAESYIGTELQLFLSSIYATLATAFPEVKIVPGARNIFLASDRPLILDPDELALRIEAHELETAFVSPPFLPSRLHPLRRTYVEEKVKSPPGRINSDLAPVSFYFQATLWSSQFPGFQAEILKFISRLPVFWLLGFPLVFFLLVSLSVAIKKKKSHFFLVPLAVMGFTTIVTEIIILVWFQALYGYLYGAIALLVSTFMLGLFLGGWTSSRRRQAPFLHLVIVQSGFVILLFLIRFIVTIKPPQLLPFLFLLVLGYLGGDLFIVSNRLYLKQKADYGIGYGLDLLGSFGGALLTSALLIPLAGLPLLLKYLLLLNFLCFLFLLLRPRG
ncbi:MAG: hypothetical protein QHH14_02410 [Clostridiales bacterium]|nr:hypothetical protein [Clostridiales bacterium]